MKLREIVIGGLAGAALTACASGNNKTKGIDSHTPVSARAQLLGDLDSEVCQRISSRVVECTAIKGANYWDAMRSLNGHDPRGEEDQARVKRQARRPRSSS